MKLPENLPRTARYGAQNARIGYDLAIENDRERFADVLGRDLPELLSAAKIEAEVDDRFARALIETGLGIGQVLALYHDALFDGLGAGPAILVERQLLDLGRVRARIADQAELELGGRAEKVLEMLRILQAGHLDQDTVVALALDRRLLGARGVDTAAKHLDRLVDGAVHLVGDPGFGELHLHEAVIRGVDAVILNGARQGGSERVGLIAKNLHDLVALGRVGNMELHAPALDADAARHLDIVFAHETADIVPQIIGPGCA